ncbi:hypothetical protein [Agrobacterium albertimagni]|nr:hypothetical protein [Agrobacterium albertimagni]
MNMLRFALIFIIGLSVVVGGRWYVYVSNTSSPYDEVGIEINSRLPHVLRKWGCDRLEQSFPNSVPPYGCGAPDSRSWI